MSGNVSYMERVIKDQPYGWEFIDAKSAPYHFSFEEIDHTYWEVLLSNWKLAITIGASYILVIFGLRRWMRDRPAFNLKGPLFWWNLCLGVFSILGFARTLPGFLHVLRGEGGFHQSICVKKGGDIPFSFWLLMFTFSKVVELGDTLFIVLRKRPLIFLQWYHHLVTMTVTWILVPLAEPVGRWYTVLNFGVHSFMYPYFAAKSKGVHVPSWIANIITTLQFSQMIIGLYVNMLSMYYHHFGHACARYPLSMNLFAVLYGSFVILFGKLFYDSVINKGKFKGGQLKTERKKLD